MSGVGRLWTWLSKSRTRSTLAFLGGGIAAIVAAGWQVYIHFAPAPTQAQTEPQVQAATAPTAGVNVAGVKRLQTSQKQALDAEADALDNVSQQIEPAGTAPRSASGAHH
ncbi:MAG TPA: hypothetical protein VGG68_13285 [Caulobacteraceae bacterium]